MDPREAGLPVDFLEYVMKLRPRVERTLQVAAACLVVMGLIMFLHLHLTGRISYGDEEPPPDSYPGPPPLPPTELPWRVRVVVYPDIRCRRRLERGT